MEGKADLHIIQQYLGGKLSPGEMHELEKRALSDPFLNEALEGYSKSGGVPAHQLSLLQRQLESRIALQAENKNRFYFSWQRLSVAAVGGLLFLLASMLFWMKAGFVKPASKPFAKSAAHTPAGEVPAATSLSEPQLSPPGQAAVPAIAQQKKPQVKKRRSMGGANSNSGSIAGPIVADDTVGAVLKELPTVQETAKGDFENFVGAYPARKTIDSLSSGENNAVVADAGSKMIRDAKEYKEYLEKALSAQAEAQKFKGSMQISVSISAAGKPGKLNIAKSGGKIMDRELAKTVANGPLWTAPVNGPVALTLDFK